MSQPTSAPAPDILIQPTVGTAELSVSKKDFDSHVSSQKKVVNWIFTLVIGIVIICFISFITFLLDAWRFHSQTLGDYKKTVEQLKSDNSTLKMEKLANRLDSIQNVVNAILAEKNRKHSLGRSSNNNKVKGNLYFEFNRPDTTK